jgi:hypothetical protein
MIDIRSNAGLNNYSCKVCSKREKDSVIVKMRLNQLLYINIFTFRSLSQNLSQLNCIFIHTDFYSKVIENENPLMVSKLGKVTDRNHLN